ncbi:hypothetical protein EJB05_11018, partial [Eragrostis curvula]
MPFPPRQQPPPTPGMPGGRRRAPLRLAPAATTTPVPEMYMELLSPSERRNALSMNGEKLQKGAMLSLVLVRTTLSRYTECKIDPRSFEFKKNKFGKPEILWQSDDVRMKWPLYFNISHTSSLIACCITMGTPIGIDFEEKKRKTAKSILSLARRYFTPPEVDYLSKIPDPEAQQKEFIKLWTLKEAYVKALGRGFSGAPFNKFSIMLTEKNGIQISVVRVFPYFSFFSSSICATCVEALLNYVIGVPKVFQDSNSSCDSLSENWQFALAELNNSHYMAACIEDDARTSGSGNGQLPPGLKIWKTIPLVEDTLVSGTKAVKLIC